MNNRLRAAIAAIASISIVVLLVGIIFLVAVARKENRNQTMVSKKATVPTPTMMLRNYPANEAGASAAITQGIGKRTTAKVSRVIDGDTFEIEGGKKVRMIGMDTPETVDPNRPQGCFGREASAKTKALLAGATVELERDISDTDKYGRLLRYVYKDGIFINEILVKEGYAVIATYPPDVKNADLLRLAEAEARQNNRGLWASCARQ